jgi:hypothetical protein
LVFFENLAGTALKFVFAVCMKKKEFDKNLSGGNQVWREGLEKYILATY